MAIFTDSNGREWKVELLLPDRKRVKEKLGVDLLGYGEDSFACKLAGQDDEAVALAIDVLYVLCEKQCAERSVSDEDFGRSVGSGEKLAEVVEIITKLILNFTLPERRKVLQAALNKTSAAMSRAMGKMSEKLAGTEIDEALDRKTDKMIAEVVAKIG